MAIIQQPGPIGSLSRGIMAGRMLQAQGARTAALKAQSDAAEVNSLANKLNAEANDRRSLAEEKNARARRDLIEAQTAVAQVEAAKTKDEDRRADIAAQIDPTRPMSVIDLASISSNIMTAAGIVPTPANTQVTASEVSGMWAQGEAKYTAELIRSKAIAQSAESRAESRMPFVVSQYYDALQTEHGAALKEVTEAKEKAATIAGGVSEKNKARSAAANKRVSDAEKNLESIQRRLGTAMESYFRSQRPGAPAAGADSNPPVGVVGHQEQFEGHTWEQIHPDASLQSSWKRVD